MLDKATLKRLLRPFNLVITTSAYGPRFKVPIIRGVGGSHRRGSEQWMTDALRRLFQLCGSSGLIDIGVNIGQTLLKLKSIDRKARYIGFEPNPFCVQFVNEISQLNGFTDCAVIPVALARAPDLFDFVADSEADSAASIHAELRPGKRSIRKQYIAALAFDSVSNRLEVDGIPIVKIDVEGAELDVLTGMKRFLQQSRPYVLCEVLHAHSEKQVALVRRRNDALMSLLNELGYAVHRFIKSSGATTVADLHPVTRFPDDVYTFRSLEVCDYLLVPAERNSEAIAAFRRTAGVPMHPACTAASDSPT